MGDKRGDLDGLLRSVHAALGEYLGVEERTVAASFDEDGDEEEMVFAFEVREWAQRTGRKVGKTGRVSQALFDEYIDYLEREDEKKTRRGAPEDQT